MGWQERQWEGEMRNAKMFLGITLGGAAMFAAAIKDGKFKEMPNKPDGEFNVVGVEGSDVVLEQDGKKFTVATESLPEEARLKLSQDNPNLKPFLDSIGKDGVKVITPERE